MDKGTLIRRKTHFVVLAVSAILSAAVASDSAIAQKLEVVTVTAPRAHQKIVKYSTVGVPIVVTSVSYGVAIADLDLSTPAGVKEFDRRVEAAARDACGELDKTDPTVPSDPTCVTEAIASTADQKKQAIAAAAR
jgi:UrcA family protein